MVLRASSVHTPGSSGISSRSLLVLAPDSSSTRASKSKISAKRPFLQVSYFFALYRISSTHLNSTFLHPPVHSQPHPYYPSPSPVPTSSTIERQQPQVRVTSPTRWSLRNALIGGGNPEFSSPFRSRSGTVNSIQRPRRPSAARLWNPTNSTPRVPARKRNRSNTQEDVVIAIPLSHPDIGSPREGAAAGGSYPLLTLSEQRQSLHLGSARASLQVERSGSSAGSNRVSLPRSVSIDIARSKSGDSPTTPGIKVDKGKGRAVEPEEEQAKAEHKKVVGLRKRGQSVSHPEVPPSPGLSFHRPNMSADLERGPDRAYTPGGTSAHPNASNTSLDAGIGPALSDSDNSSIIGSEGGGNAEDQWGPQHPCFPHMNSHVPLSSPLYQTTRIIRIRRDWMIAGDLAPTFSNLYPEILDPAGVSEQDFRQIIEKVNNELVPAFNPWGVRNMFDAMMGLVTGWLWDDFGLTAVKSRLNKVEQFLEEWNREMERKSKEGAENAPRIVPLRRTGYMNLDIQVPDPEISYPSSMPPDDRTATGLSRALQ
ncbi:Golgin subfamily A member 7/ERF4 family-domain-containing protein [Tricladium varicosporioides]|nr:Golgin subfamily A member 7/ERF4 family-domain-containing protein [Hymenoscyphus varicosporioides]